MTAAPLPDWLRHVHLVGVGGPGMSGLARLLLRRGAAVSGSDAKDSRRLAALRALGVKVAVGHEPAHVAGATTLIYSRAIPEDNVEVVAARARGLRVMPHAAALAALTAGYRTVAVAGTHGKTTTTSMITVAFQACGLDPSFVIGGDLNEAGSNAHAGSGDLFLVEADESDGAFLHLSPQVALVTNVEPEHLDHYRTPAAVTEAFDAFAGRIGAGGQLIACADDPGAMRLAEQARSRVGGPSVTTYGLAEEADVRVELPMVSWGASACEVVARGRRLGELSTAVAGRHNLVNAAGALACGLVLGLPAASLLEGLASFTGVRRRFEPKGEVAGVRVVDDYANHPTKVATVLRAARDVADGGRVVVAFQPHLYSRTSQFAAGLGAALGLADAVVVMDVFGGGEDPLAGVSGASVAAAVPLPAEAVVYEPSWSAAAGRVAALARPGDLVLTVGAGDVTLLGPELLRTLAERPPSSSPPSQPRPASPTAPSRT